jgi:hypothetical protein
MRNCLYLILLTALVSCTVAYGQDVPQQRSTDTLWIDSITTHSGQKAALEINFANADTLNAIDLPLTYKYPDLMVDSVSFVGSRIENSFLTIVNIDTLAAICHIGAFYFDTTKEEVGPGSGLFARIHLTIPDDYETRLIPFDTTRISTGLTFVSKDNEAYVPIFHQGYVDNTFAPALDDSVWVNDADVVPGEHFSVTMNAYNELPINNIKIPIQYQSDNIVFDSVSVAGTRAFHAIVVDAVSDDVQKKALIILKFSSDQLMPPGNGSLSVLHFTCLFAGTTSNISVDTTEFEFGEYYFQLGELYGYVKAFPDFHAGTITVDLSTDADDETSLNLPSTYSLGQNHPNPFNPVTAIEFALPERSQVTLDVFNVLGQRVRRLLNQTLPAGNHNVVFDGRDNDGSELASGIYFYRIRAGQFTQSRKMMLIK